MQYDIRLSGSEQDDGSISFERINLLTGVFMDIAKGALQIRLLGASAPRGRTAQNIARAIEMRFTGLSEGSTVLHAAAAPFATSLPETQRGDLFNDQRNELAALTPMSLLMQTFRDALSMDEAAQERLDKPLLQKLKQVKKLFVSEEETLTISNRGSVPELELHSEDLERIASVEESIPDPQPILLHGYLEAMKWRGARVTLITDSGSIGGLLTDDVNRDMLATFWGKPLTVAGIAHYRPDGKMAHVEIERVFSPSESDTYFSQVRRRETIEQQVARQLREGKNSAVALQGLVGLLGDEDMSDEDFNEMLKQLD